ncbi:MAG TPA: DUF559 domain-containing protein [Gallionellaceae bacterium]|nr:DUF559 domain-containing protein [Gallionellaceae bacterium]
MEKYRIDPRAISRARKLRSNLTDAEQKLWYALRGKQLLQSRFRRQHPVGQYIADFACIEVKLIVEVDGGQHQECQSQDEVRSQFLQQHGWRVLRFWNHDVLQNLEGVLQVIAEQLRRPPPP